MSETRVEVETGSEGVIARASLGPVSWACASTEQIGHDQALIGLIDYMAHELVRAKEALHELHERVAQKQGGDVA